MLTTQPNLSFIFQFGVIIDGSPINTELKNLVLEVVIEDSLHLPALASIRFQDANLVPNDDQNSPVVDMNVLSIGKAIEIKVGDENSPMETLFKGEITHIEGDLAAHAQPTVIVRCLSKLHRLHRGRKRKSYLNSSDSDVVSKVVRENGLRVSATSTSEIHPFIFQNNETDYQFLTRLANRCGFRLYEDRDQTVRFEKIEDPSSADVVLTWGVDLRSFRPRISAAPQETQVDVRGWDYHKKEAIVGSASDARGEPTVGAGNFKKATQAFGSATTTITDQIVDSAAGAKTLAQSVLDTMANEYVEAEGLCDGFPRLRAGSVVEVRGVGSRFSGNYKVSSTTHTYNAIEGYTTTFAIDGKGANSVLEMIGDRSDRRHDNVMVGLVTDNRDPGGGGEPGQELGRVKVTFPTLDSESYWARVASPMAGHERGFFFLPEIGDEVLVAFEHGDIHRPYIIGQLWNGKDKTPMPQQAATADGVVHRVIKTRIGHILLFDDSRDNQKIEIKTAGGHQFLMDDKNKIITIKSSQGHVFNIDDQNNKIEISSSGGTAKTTMDTAGGKVDTECNGNYTLKSKGKVLIEGLAGVEVKTPAQVLVEGSASATLKSPGMTTVESTGITTVKGSLVKIN